jgi:peptide/nickel transport system permease protein
MRLWVLRRLLLGVVTLLVVSVVVFLVTRVLPGDPARAILGNFAEPEQLAAVREQTGLDKPLVSQYLSWLDGVLHGSLGTSFATQTSVGALVGERLANSLTLLFTVAIVAVPLSVVVGVAAARRRDRLFDHAVVGGSIALAGLPEFVIGILLVALFATSVLHVLPAVDLVPPGENPIASPRGMVLPVATLILAVVPYLARLFRAAMIEALDTSYVEMARLKGVPERTVFFRHALRNALVPGIQGTGLALIYLLGNVVVVEYLFNYPGLGSGLASAVSVRDLPVIQASALVFGAMFVLFNILADLLTVYATPRLRTEV